jgi:aminocarboxymuconate-semialdehyde decarboxylase
MIVDAHNHIFPQPVIDLLKSDPGFGVTVTATSVSSGSHADHALFPALYDPEVKLSELRDRKLDGAVFSLAPRLFSYELPTELGIAMAEAANKGLEEFAAYDSGRFGWMGHLPLQDPDLSAEMVGELAARGAVGIEVGSAIAEHRLDEESFEPFWAAAEDAGLLVFVHPAYIPRLPGIADFYLRNVIGNPLETTICVERLLSAGVLDRHPKVKILLAHGGGFFPYQAGRLRHARTVRKELADAPADPWQYTGQLLFDTITHDGPALEYLIARAGAENVVIGTDHPYDMGEGAPVDALRQVTDDETFTQIAERNPARLFDLQLA